MWNWWLVPAALLVAALFLALGWWLAVGLMGLRPASVSLFDAGKVQAELRAQRDQNAALEREIEARRRALEGDVCRADPAQLPSLGPDHAAAPPADAVPPPPGAAPFQGNLADLLKQATVMVLVPGEGGLESGSGFFVAPDLIVTNHHVIAESRGGKIYVANEKLGHWVAVSVVAATPQTAEEGKLDLALLRLPAAAQVQPLALTPTVAQLDPVIAAGYPGLTLQSDAAFRRMVDAGDASQIPGVIMTDGKISAIQNAAGLAILPHSAALSGGSSGGPLVDACGRVVGVNTFIVADAQQAAHVNYAQKIDAVVAFLGQHGGQPTVVTGRCQPAGSAPAGSAPAAPAPAAPAGGAPAASPSPAPAAPHSAP